MVTKQKLIAVLVLSLFTLQNCAKGVSPTPITGSGNENTDNGQISASLCALQGDGDDDHDGICNHDDVADNGTDCSQQATGCITPGQDDGMSKPSKNKTWLYITGAVAAIGVGSVAAKLVTGHWWWKGSGSNDASQIVKIANDGKTVTLSSTESFFTNTNNQLEGITRIKSQVGKMIWDLEYIANEHVAKGDKVDICVHGQVGLHYDGQLLNASDSFNQKVTATYYFYEGAPPGPDVPGYYDQFSKGVKMEKTAFDHLCDVGGRLGQYVAYETDDGKYFVSAIPLRTETEQVNKAITIAYLFNAIPNSDADVLNNLKYKRYDPAHVGDVNYATAMFDITAFSGTSPIVGGDPTLNKFKKVFGSTHTTKAEAVLTTQQNLIQQEKNTEPVCSADLCN